MAMIAPIVPNGLMRGSGMKYGSEASTRWIRAATKCPNSCVRRMARRGTAKRQPLGRARRTGSHPWSHTSGVR
jgi:hypothetical protein